MRFSSEYECLESELTKAQSIHGTRQPDWHKILETSERLLRQQSKDLRVAVWMTWALYQRESYPGLLAGLGLLRYLCEHHWLESYPEKLRTRSAAFAWLVLRIEPLFAQGLPLQNQQLLFRAVLEHLTSLEELWGRHLGDDAPLLLPIRRQLAQRLEQALQADAPAAGLSGVIAQVKQATSQLLKSEPVVDNEKDAGKLLRTLQEQARPLCAWWLRQNATDLRALRLNRTLNWLVLSGYPDADSERVTTLRGPAPEKLKRYQERFAQGHHADLVLELEASLAGAMFWFDGLHMLWQCLEALRAEQAMIELEVTFALLLQRLPDLPSFCFHDSIPFADAASRDWITLQVSRHLQTPESAAVVIDTEAEPWESALQPAMGVFLALTHCVVLWQQVAAAIQKLGDLKGQLRLPVLKTCVLQFVVQVFELDLRQLMLAGLHTQARLGKPPMKSRAFAASGIHPLFEFMDRGFEPVLSQPGCDCLCLFDLEAVLE